MNIEVGFYNLWLIFVTTKALTWLLLAIGDKLRGVKIVNPEDHKNIKVSIIGYLPLLAFLGVSVFTPIAVGTLFWTGCVLLVIAGTIYVLAIVAFVKCQKGLNTIGIYQASRNPMYVAMFLSFIAFTLMAWQAGAIMGILGVFITLASVFVVQWMVVGEERFLIKKYGDAYRKYINETARYAGMPKKKL